MPKRKNITRFLSILLTLFVFFTGLNFIFYIGGSGVLNDLYFALNEVQDLEHRNLLDNPPADTSPITLREIKLVHNSAGLRKYIEETQKNVAQVEISLIFFIILTTLILGAHLYYRKKKDFNSKIC